MSTIHSMTGYGRGESSDSHRVYLVEARGVNGRYLDVICRVPRELAPLEELIARESESFWGAEVALSVEYAAGSSRNFILDEELATKPLQR